MAEIKKKATRAAYGEFLGLGEKINNEKLIVMDADLSGSTKTKEFAKVFPERFVQSGIAEQDLMAEAAGIALSGHVVCASTFAMFAAGRAYEIIRNSIGYTGANVKICATHAGITVGEDGASHQTLEDIALMRDNSGDDGHQSFGCCIRKTAPVGGGHGRSCYVRLGRASVPSTTRKKIEIVLGKAKQLQDGKDLTIIATGIMVPVP